MDLEGMGSVPPADEAEIKNLQQQGWDVETASADDQQRADIENGLIGAGMDVQVFANPDGQTYTILRKAPESLYDEDAAETAVGEDNPESISDKERNKMQEVFPGLFGNPEDEGQDRAA